MALSYDLKRGSNPVICTSNRNKLLRLISGEISVKCYNNIFPSYFLYKAKVSRPGISASLLGF